MPISKRIKHNRYNRFKRAKKTKFYLISFLIGAVLTFGFYSIFKTGFNYFKKDSVTVAADSQEVQEDLPQTRSVKNPDELLAEIEKYLGEQQGEYAYQITELASGQTFGMRAENQYVAASTIKVPIAAYLFNQIDKGNINPDKTLTFTNSDYEDGTGVLQAYQFGTSFKISYLAEVMITKSDNVATNMLLRYLGASNIQYFMNQNGLPSININENTVTPRAMNQLLTKIENRQIVGEASASKILGYMNGSLDSARLVAGVPSSVRVSHKIGTAVGALSDIGVFYLNDKKYVLSVYSKNVIGEVTPKNVIKYISHYVYDYESAK